MQPAAPEPGAGEFAPAPGVPESQQLTALLSSLERLVGEQVNGGRHLVQALTDQLADGQVETLHSLHTATAAVRRQVQHLEQAADTPLREVRALVVDLQAAALQLGRTATTATQTVADALTEDVAARLVEVEDALTSSARQTAQSASDGLREQLALESAGIASRLTGLVAGSADLWANQLSQTSTRLAGEAASTEARLVARAAELERAVTAAAEAAIQRIASAGEALEATTRNLDSQLVAVRSALEQQVAEATAALAEAGVAAAAEVHAAGDELLQGLRAEASATYTSFNDAASAAQRRLEHSGDKVAAVATATVDGIEFAGRALSDALAVRAEVLAEQHDDFLAGVQEQLEAQEQRDQRLVARSDARVQRLVERSDRAVTQLVEKLGTEVDRLATRDRELEAERADQFVRVLDDVLSRAGRRGRDLRDRVSKVLQADRQERAPMPGPPEPEPPPPPPPAVEPEAVAPPTPARPRKRAPRKLEDNT